MTVACPRLENSIEGNTLGVTREKEIDTELDPAGPGANLLVSKRTVLHGIDKRRKP